MLHQQISPLIFRQPGLKIKGPKHILNK